MSTLNLATSLGTVNGSSYNSYYGSGRNRVFSSAAQNRVARDMASNYSSTFDDIKGYLEDGETDTAMQLYKELFDRVSDTATDYGYSYDEGQIKTVVNDACERSLGASMTDLVSKKASSSFVTGLKEGVPLLGWFGNGTSKAEARAELTGKSAKFSEGIKESVGSAVSSGICTAAGAAAVMAFKGTLISAVATGGLALVPIAAAGLVGLVAGLLIPSCKNK